LPPPTLAAQFASFCSVSLITGSDFLLDGGVTAAYWYGDLAPK
jgi:hypothetical protein